MSERIYLWKEKAPYSDESPLQEQPSVKPFICPDSKGAVIVIPGGGYRNKAAHEGDPIAEMINEGGISAFVLDYRVAPCNKMAPLSDANRAVRLVRSLGYEKVAVLGFSAGGNLCATAATHYDAGDQFSQDPVERYSSRPDAFIPCYAVSSLISYANHGTVINLLGDECTSFQAKRFFSAELNITADTPPAFIWHTAEDQSVPVESALMLARALSDHAIPYELHIFPKGRHGIGLAKDIPLACQWTKLLKNWLHEEGFDK